MKAFFLFSDGLGLDRGDFILVTGVLGSVRDV